MNLRSVSIRVVLVSLAAIVTASLCYLSFRTGRATAKAVLPRVGFVETEVDLGQFVWGSKARAQVHFENRSSTDVELASVSSSCGCAVVDGAEQFERRVVAAGETVPVEVELDVGSTSPMRSASIRAILMDGRDFAVMISADVKREWFVSKEKVDFGDITLGAAEAPRIVVMFWGKADTITGDLKSTWPWLDAVVRPPTADEKGTQSVVLSVRPDKLPPGRNTARVLFNTSNTVVPSGTITVSARGVAEIVAMPAKLFLRPGSSERVRFFDTKGQPVELASADSFSSLSGQVESDGFLLVSTSTEADLPNGVPLRVRDRLGRQGVVQVATVRVKGEQVR